MGVRGLPLPWLAARAALAPHPKSLRQIGKLGFFGTNSGSVYEPLMWEVRFVLEAERGDRSIGEANLRKGAALQWPACLMSGRCTLRLPCIQKYCAKSRELGFPGTNSGSIYEPLSREVRFVLEAERGDRSIGEANLRKGAALQWLARLAPVRGVSPFNGSGTATPFNGRHASCLADALRAPPFLWKCASHRRALADFITPAFRRICSDISIPLRARVSWPPRPYASSSGRLLRTVRSVAGRRPF